MRCAVCGIESESVKEQRTVRGTRYGMACPGECQGLLWEAHFNKAINAGPYEHALVLWAWQRRRAEVAGQPFTTPPPKSPAEVATERWASSFGGAQ